MSEIARNIAALKKQLHNTENGNHVTLVAISKMQPDARIEQALTAGQRVFGENRVQEAIERWGHRRESYPDLSLHLVGGLQSNKARDAVALFDVIETIDRPNLADAVLAEMQRQKREITCLVQVNTGAEEQKSGVALDALPDLLDHCRKIGLPIKGLMCIPPVNDPAGLHFVLLKKLAQRHGLEKLSMGMSGDFEKALRVGTDYIRIGTALFGQRDL